jgi:hypothetical protein
MSSKARAFVLFQPGKIFMSKIRAPSSRAPFKSFQLEYDPDLTHKKYSKLVCGKTKKHSSLFVHNITNNKKSVVNIIKLLSLSLRKGLKS